MASDIQTTLESAIAFLCRAETGNFYAYVMNSVERVYVKGLGTFGVAPMGSRYTLFIDPDAAKQMSFEEIVATIEHEILHIILNHPPRFLQIWQQCETERARQLFFIIKPIAIDAAVNEILRANHPRIADPSKPLGYWVLAEEFDLPRGQSAEQYFLHLLRRLDEEIKEPGRILREVMKMLAPALEALEEVMPNHPSSLLSELLGGDRKKGKGTKKDGEEGDNGQGGEGDGQGEGNDAEGEGEGGDGELTDGEKKLAAAVAKGMLEHLGDLLGDHNDPARPGHIEENGKKTIRTSLENYQKKRGTMPAGLQQILDDFLRAPMVPWSELFRALIQNAIRSKPVRGFRRISRNRAALAFFYQNRRLPLFPGVMRDEEFHIVYIIDTSGSMREDEMRLGLSELKHAQKSAARLRLTVMYVDAGVAKRYEIGPDDDIDLELVGRGGTDFDAGLEAVGEIIATGEQVDLVVYVTDGECPKPHTKLPCTVLWLITPGRRFDMNEPGHLVLELKEYPAGTSA